jgi:hypothetical protein
MAIGPGCGVDGTKPPIGPAALLAKQSHGDGSVDLAKQSQRQARAVLAEQSQLEARGAAKTATLAVECREAGYCTPKFWRRPRLARASGIELPADWGMYCKAFAAQHDWGLPSSG